MKKLVSAFIICGKKRSPAVSTGLNDPQFKVTSCDRGGLTMHGPFVGEFMGTLILILLGDGVVANVLLKKSKGENSGWMVIATAWGMAVVAGICTAVACGSPGAHINPAVTLAFAIISKNWSNVAFFWLAQILGAFAGATLVWL